MGATPPGHSPGGGSQLMLATALYLVAVALIAQGVAHALNVGGIAAPIGSVRWRFGFMGIVFLQVSFPLLGLAFGSLTAALLRHRHILLAFTGVQGLLGVAAGGALIMFLLDAAQIGATVPPALRGNYNVVVAQTSAFGAGAVLLILGLAMGSLRALRADPGARARAKAPAAPPIVGR